MIFHRIKTDNITIHFQTWAGFSDPYCILGVQLGASNHSGAWDSNNLTAKQVSTTKVKNATLNPTWQEQFTLYVKANFSSTFHFCINHFSNQGKMAAAKYLNYYDDRIILIGIHTYIFCRDVDDTLSDLFHLEIW